MSVSLDGFVETPSRSLESVQVDDELHAFCATKLGARLDERRIQLGTTPGVRQTLAPPARR
jgi:hypothetical protein